MKAKRLISFLLALCLIASFFVGALPQAYAAETSLGFGTVNLGKGNEKETTLVYDKPNGKSFTSLKHGTQVSILDQVKDENGNQWYKIRYTPKVEGYMPKSKISFDNPSSTSTTAKVGFVNEKVTSCLLVRSDPSDINYRILERLYCGDQVTIINSQTIKNVKWYKIRTKSGKEGWCKSEYITQGSSKKEPSSSNSPSSSKLKKETIEEKGSIISRAQIYTSIAPRKVPHSKSFTGGEGVFLSELITDSKGNQYYYFEFGKLAGYIDKDNAIRVSEEEFHGRPVSIDTTKKGTVNKKVTSNLLVRSDPSDDNYKTLERLRCGDQVSIIQSTTIKGVKWFRIITKNGTEGWCKAEYIDECSNKTEQNNSTSTKIKRESISGTGTVLRKTTAHKYSDKSSKEDLMFLGGEHVSLFELVTIGNQQRYGCRFGSKVWYIDKADVRTSVQQISSATNDSQPQKGKLQGIVRVQTRLSCRVEPSTKADVVETLFNGASVEVLETKTVSKTKWYLVRTQKGNKGWCLAAYIEIGTWKLISSAETYNYRSGTNSRFNAERVSSRLTGLVLSPNQQFSWLYIVGECGKEQGYKKAKVIVNGKYVDGYGGGVCQVSTTINIAIMRMGIPTIRRKHSLPSVYAKPEEEATVSYPNVDFKFTNTQKAPIKLELRASAGYCTCNVYIWDQS